MAWWACWNRYERKKHPWNCPPVPGMFEEGANRREVVYSVVLARKLIPDGRVWLRLKHLLIGQQKRQPGCENTLLDALRVSGRAVRFGTAASASTAFAGRGQARRNAIRSSLRRGHAVEFVQRAGQVVNGLADDIPAKLRVAVGNEQKGVPDLIGSVRKHPDIGIDGAQGHKLLEGG